MALIDNILAYWKLDESSGDPADSVASYDLTNTGSVPFVSGKINNGASVLYTRYFTRGDILGRSSGNNGSISISLWAKFSNIGAGGNIIEINDGVNSPYIQWAINVTSTKIRFNRGRLCVANVYTDVNMTVNTGVWYHIVLVWNGSTLTPYIDNSAGSPGSPTGNGTSCGGQVVKVGSSNLGDVACILDEVGVWDRALSSDEVSELYNSGDGLQYPFSPLAVYAISGQVTLSSNPVDGATVRCIRQSDNTAIAEQTTDSSGLYTFSDLDSEDVYHLAVEYEADSVKYNAKSLWDIVPYEVT